MNQKVDPAGRRRVIDEVATETGWSKKQAKEAVTATLKAISTVVSEGNPVSLKGFGTYHPYVTEVKERSVFGEEMVTGGKRKVRFTASKVFFTDDNQ